MRNEFDDELDRDTRKKGARGFNSEPDPSDEDYFLDEDYESYQNPEQNRINHTAGAGRAKESGQSMFRGQSSSESSRSRGQAQSGAGKSQARTSEGSGKDPAPSQAGAGKGHTRTQAEPGDSKGRAQTSQGAVQDRSQTSAGKSKERIQASAEEGQSRPRTASGESSQSRPRTASGESGQSRPRTASGENGQAPIRTTSAESGQSRPRTASAEGSQTRPRTTSSENGQSRTQAPSGTGEGQRASGNRGRIPSENGQSAATGQPQAASRLVIGDGGTRQQPRIQNQEKNVSGSRLAVQTEKKKKIRRIIILAVAEIFTLALIFSYAYVARLMNSFQRPDNVNQEQVGNKAMPDELKKHMTGYRTIAVFGVDSRDGNVNRANADVIMICNINRDTGEIRLVSVFRDTYLNISDKNAYNKINAAYALGGASQALAALNKNLDLDISEYVTFNWKSVADGINMLGGVDIDISKAEFRYINSFITETVNKTGVPSVHLKSAGMNHLDGVQAVAYARLRKMDTDYARTERQRLVIQKTFEKAKKADLGLLNRILLMEVEQVGTNLTFSDFTELLLDLSKYHIGETAGFPSARGEMTVGKRGDCVIPQTLETNVAELHKFLFGKEDYVPSDMVKKISAKIAADSGMYKQGTSIDHVSTEGKDTEEKTTEATKPEKTTSEVETSSQEGSIEETDENGKPVKPSDSSKGNGETKETKPGETTSGATKPGETTSGAVKPGETTSGTTKPTTETTTAANGPGVGQTTGANEPGSVETTSAGPGGGGEPSSSQANPADNAGDIPVVSAPDIN